MAEQKNIYQKIPQIIGEIEAITKAHKNQSQNYMFRSVDDVYQKLNPLLAKHEVFVVPKVVGKEIHREAKKTSVSLDVEYSFYSSDGSSFSAVVTGEAIDYGDKATQKALSMAFKYLMFQVFCIPTDEKLDTEVSNEAPKLDPNDLDFNILTIESGEHEGQLWKDAPDKYLKFRAQKAKKEGDERTMTLLKALKEYKTAESQKSNGDISVDDIV